MDYTGGGASCAMAAGVTKEDIMKHGTWKSDSVWTYIDNDVVHKSVVARSLGNYVMASRLSN